MKTTIVADLSNYSGVPDFRRLADHDGIHDFYLGTQNPSITSRQHDACLAAGSKVRGLYVFVYWDAFGPGDDQRRLNQALKLSRDFGGSKIWYDAEWLLENNYLLGLPNGITPKPEILVPMMQSHMSFLGPHLEGTYTGRWWWVPRTHDSHIFAGMRLWHADYLNRPPTSEEIKRWVPYGGFKLAAWQYSSMGVDGVTCDLSLLLEEDEMESSMKNWNVPGTWWNNRLLTQTPDGESYTMQARSDFQLPVEAVRVRIGVYLDASNGYLRFWNADGSEAEPVGWGGGAQFGTTDVILAADGTIKFAVQDGDAQTAIVRSLGYWT